MHVTLALGLTGIMRNVKILYAGFQSQHRISSSEKMADASAELLETGFFELGPPDEDELHVTFSQGHDGSLQCPRPSNGCRSNLASDV